MKYDHFKLALWYKQKILDGTQTVKINVGLKGCLSFFGCMLALMYVGFSEERDRCAAQEYH